MKKFLSALTAGAILMSAIPAVAVNAEAAQSYGKFEYTVLSDNTVRIESFSGGRDDVEVTVPETINGLTVTQLGSKVFNTAFYVATVKVPSTVTKIQSDAFDWKLDDHCNVTEIIVDEGNPEYTSYEGNLYSKDMTRLERYVSDKTDFTLPETVKTISSGALAGLTLNKVVIPDGALTIDSKAFMETSVNTLFVPSSLNEIKDGAFPKLEGYSNGYVGSVKYSGTAAQWKSVKIGEDNDLLTPIRSKNHKSTLYIKESTSVKSAAVISTTDTTDKLRYTSDNKKVAKVNSSGKLTAVKAGRAVITVKNEKFKKSFTVTVKKPKLSRKTVSVKKNHTVSLKIIGKVKGVNNKYINTKYAKITSKKTSSTLKVKGIKRGISNVRVIVSGVTLKLKVKVV